MRGNQMEQDITQSQDSTSQNAPRAADEQLATALRRIEACEAALEESEARFRNVIEQNADAIIVVSRDGMVEYANAMAGRMFGIEPARLRGTPFGFPIVAGETTAVDVVVDGVARTAELRVVESMWNGVPVCLASLRDVTELEQARRERTAQLAAQLAEARMRDIFSQAPVAIAVLRGPEHRYDLTNARYAELIAGRDVVGKPIREALPELAGQGIYERLDGVYTTGTPFVGTEVRLMIERRKGSVEETFFTFVYQPLRESDGSISGVAIVASDVTTQVRARNQVETINRRLQEQATQLEKQAAELAEQYAKAQKLAEELEAANHLQEETFKRERQARAEAEEANKAKSDFLATMSHELRTPLNAIGGYTDLILAGIRGPITDAQKTDLERINRSQRHLLAVINDILNFAKVEAGRVQLHARDISMNEVLGGLESLVAPILLQKEIAYEYLCCDPSYTAHADPERLQQILLNLLSNAAKFTQAGGKITVECAATKTAMLVRVSDTGVGIPADKLHAVFEPFVQLDRGQLPGMGGTGIGLSISRDLARAMGGDLRAESTPGQGSTFVLKLPRFASPTRARTEPVADALAHASGERLS
jgi:signal transduction histidine kinase